MKSLIPLFIALIIGGCSSGKKQFEKGNYETAVSQAVNRLRNNPNSKKAAETLKKAYPLAEKTHLAKIKQLKGTTEEFKWDQIARSYDQLNSMHEQVSRCPACIKALPKIKSYRSEYNDAAVLAAEERYAAGIRELRKGDRESAKEAFYHFSRVESLQSNYKDTPRKIQEARDLATLHVLVDQIPIHSRSLGLSHEFFQNRLYEEVERRTNDFVRFYSAAEAQRMRLSPDQIIVLQFDDFVVGQVFLKESSKTVSRDSVVVGTTEVDGEKLNVYGTVEAEFITFKKYIDSGGLLDMRIYDAETDRILFQRKMPGEYNWLTEWATYKGDKRALTDEEFALTRLNEPPSPSAQFLFEQFCQPIYSQAVNNIRNFYRNY